MLNRNPAEFFTFPNNKRIEDGPETAAGFSTCSQAAEPQQRLLETLWFFWDQKRSVETAFEPKLWLSSTVMHTVIAV